MPALSRQKRREKGLAFARTMCLARHRRQRCARHKLHRAERRRRRLPFPRLLAGALRRTKATAPQSALSAEERYTNLADAFAAAPAFLPRLAGRAHPAFGRCIYHRSDSQPMRQDTQGGRCSCSASCRFGNRKPLCVRTFRAVRFSLVKKDLRRCTKTFRIVLVVRVCGCKSKPGAGKRIHVSRHAGVRAVIMAYLRSKSSENRVKASVGAKTRSAGRHLQNFHKTQKRV